MQTPQTSTFDSEFDREGRDLSHGYQETREYQEALRVNHATRATLYQHLERARASVADIQLRSQMATYLPATTTANTDGRQQRRERDAIRIASLQEAISGANGALASEARLDSSLLNRDSNPTDVGGGASLTVDITSPRAAEHASLTGARFLPYLPPNMPQPPLRMPGPTEMTASQYAGIAAAARSVAAANRDASYAGHGSRAPPSDGVRAPQEDAVVEEVN